jgi:hypothetical protein
MIVNMSNGFEFRYMIMSSYYPIYLVIPNNVNSSFSMPLKSDDHNAKTFGCAKVTPQPLLFHPSNKIYKPSKHIQ